MCACGVKLQARSSTDVIRGLGNILSVRQKDDGSHLYISLKVLFVCSNYIQLLWNHVSTRLSRHHHRTQPVLKHSHAIYDLLIISCIILRIRTLSCVRHPWWLWVYVAYINGYHFRPRVHANYLHLTTQTCIHYIRSLFMCPMSVACILPVYSVYTSYQEAAVMIYSMHRLYVMLWCDTRAKCSSTGTVSIIVFGKNHHHNFAIKKHETGSVTYSL